MLLLLLRVLLPLMLPLLPAAACAVVSLGLNGDTHPGCAGAVRVYIARFPPTAHLLSLPTPSPPKPQPSAPLHFTPPPPPCCRFQLFWALVVCAALFVSQDIVLLVLVSCGDGWVGGRPQSALKPSSRH